MKPARTTTRRRHQPWDEQTIRAALTEFLRGREVWPTCEEFALGGAKGLREAITRVHGAAWWANEMGLPGGGRSPGGVRRWTDEAIRTTLAEFFEDRATWPSNREFDEAGLHALREALRHYGGPRRWSQVMGVSWTPRATRSRPRAAHHGAKPSVAPSREWPKWNQRTIAEALSTFLAERDEWPRYSDFVSSGRKGLYQAVLKHGGTRAWAERMGVKWVTRFGGSAPQWTETRIRERLAVFLDGRTVWPWTSEFIEAGEGALLAAARRIGGVEHWVAVFGVDPIPRTSGRSARPRRPTLSWDDDRIAAAIGPLIEELGHWPTKGEFRRAGLIKALAAVYGHGGSSSWQRRFGVSPRPFDGPLPDRRRWSRQRVEAELRDFCVGRSTWPTLKEFQASGKHGLYRAASRYGGIQYWRARFQLDASPTTDRTDA